MTTRALDWISAHGATLLVSACAFLAGMAVMLPMGWTLDGAAAGLIGALVGAVATIGGAILLWQIQEKHRTQHLAKAIAMQFGAVFHGSHELLQHLPRGEVDDLDRASANLLKDIDETKAKLDRFAQSLHMLTSTQIGDLLIAEEIVKTIRVQGERIAQVFATVSQPVWIPDVLDDVHRGLAESYDDLGKRLERFAPGWSKEAEDEE